MFKSILVPLDGSAFGDYAIPFAVEIARRTNAVLELVQVHVERAPADDLYALTPYRYQGVSQYYDSCTDETLQREEFQLQEKARLLGVATGLQVVGRLAHGLIDSAVEHEAETFHADLIVMATHGRTGLARATFGSIADRVVRHSKVPVLLVRPHTNGVPADAPLFRRILVALDGSDFSAEILPPVADLARVYDANVTMLHAVQTPAIEMLVGVGQAALPVPSIDPATAYLGKLADSVNLPHEPSLDVRQTLHAANAIVDSARQHGADMIAMATHGRGGLSRFLVGSTASEVLARTSLPVLLYRPAAVRAAANEASLATTA
jgi:nucleotide-binding universal stress UspA family protein